MLLRVRTASTPIAIENEKPDCGRKIELEALAALTVEGRNEAADRSSLSGSNFLERIPKGVLHGHAAFMPVEYDAPFTKKRFFRGGLRVEASTAVPCPIELLRYDPSPISYLVASLWPLPAGKTRGI